MNPNELEQRTLSFSRNTIALCNQIFKNVLNNHIGLQLIRSSTFVGANYREALEAESKKDFIHKISLCKKEAKESLYWIELLSDNNISHLDDLKKLWKEARELLLIFAKTIDTAKKNESMSKR